MAEEARRDDLVHLLWTGGWDSTFRLLQLILVKQRAVQPYYLVDTARRSFATEILAMNAVKRYLTERHGGPAVLLRPTILRDVADIPPDEEITASYRRICETTHIGIQYEWGARFARAEGLSRLELSLIGGGHMFGIFEPLLREERDGEDVNYAIDPSCRGTDIHRVFRDYRFPLIMMTKQQMLVEARRHGFGELLMMTVFCHSPRRDGRACGLCIPCGIAVDNGLGWRLPRTSRLKNRWQRRYRKLRKALERFPRLFPIAQKAARALKRKRRGTIPVR